MALLDLPAELISQILSYMTPMTLEAVARTCNRRLTPMCLALPAVKQRILNARNRREIYEDFEPPKRPPPTQSNISAAAYEKAGMYLVFGPFSLPPSLDLSHPFGNMDYLGLYVDLKWMDTLPLFPKPRRWFEYSSRVENLPVLMECASSLGLTIPPAFLRLFQDDNLYGRVNIGEQLQLETLYRVFHESDEGVRSYIIRFGQDDEGNDQWYLYLNSRGNHCVCTSLGFSNETAEADREDDEENTRPYLSEPEENLDVKGIPLEEFLGAVTAVISYNFESWLAGTCYRDWAYSRLEERQNTLQDGDWKQMPMGLIRYVASAYTKKGRQAIRKGRHPVVLDDLTVVFD